MEGCMYESEYVCVCEEGASLYVISHPHYLSSMRHFKQPARGGICIGWRMVEGLAFGTEGKYDCDFRPN